MAILVTCMIGLSFAFLMRWVHSPPNIYRRVLIVIFVGECIWIGTAGLLSSWTTGVLLHWVHRP